jgi:hypothetical protein
MIACLNMRVPLAASGSADTLVKPINETDVGS